MNKAVVLVLIVALVVAFATHVHSMPRRIKRVSDQRLAELETLIALSKMRGKLVTVPIGFGRIDPAKIGRRRRSLRKRRQYLEDLEVERLLLEEESASAEKRPSAADTLLLRDYLLNWSKHDSDQ
ncbi:uncharacterized protein LOC132199429 [Neocloeon triangulifer]|uniref:uncharacterized protein LOC132199429 n=1 Tax=Neocloeon triangulifer TaxID=2078957 RepID=UPI00286F53C4|nr:uncharacterized protein LOC132199429 [Neocloeon triangulifer]